jgi:hypothetical protein
MKSKLIIAIILAACVYRATAQELDSVLIKHHVFTLASDSLMGRGFGTAGGRMAADYIITQFKGAGIMPWQGSYLHPFISSGLMAKTEGANVVGWIEGSDSMLKGEYIVIGAHYDHLAYKINDDGTRIVFNGADDNASGVASIIEIGKWLVENRTQLKRSVIVVAFDGEEAGLVGSSFMVQHMQVPPQQVKAMFSLDMVGMLSRYGGIDLNGDKTLENGDVMLHNLASKHGLTVKKDGRKVVLNTDTAPFGNQGIPAIHVFTSTVSPYHKPEDDAEKLDYPGIAAISGFVADAAVQLSNAETLEPSRRFVAQQNNKLPKFGLRLGFGTSGQNYSNEFYMAKNIFAFQAGLYAKQRLSRRFTLQPEIIYQTMGGKHADGTLRTHEVSIPVNVRMSLNPASAASTFIANDFYLLIGPYYSYRFGGSLGGKNMDFDSAFRREDYGIQGGFGFEVMNVQLQISRFHSFKSIDRTTTIIPTGILWTLGLRF